MIRIARLDLERWGHFEGRSLEFGDAGSLHVVFGPNEAGKSTTRRAIGALLFGVPERTGDTYGRAPSDLRIGARLELGPSDDDVVEVVRRKGRKDTLLDGDGAPLDPAPLEAALGGVTREVHEGLFEITHERLVQGGMDLLAGRGAVGESLFAAAAGTSRLHALMRRLEADADELFSTRPSKKELNVLLARHAETLRVLRDASLRPPRWEQLSRELDELEKAYALAGEELLATDRERARLGRLQGVLPLVAQRETAARALAALGELPELAADASTRRAAALERRRDARARARAAERELERRRARLEELTVDDALLPRAAQIDALHARASAVAQDTERRAELNAQSTALATRVEASSTATPDDATRARSEAPSAAVPSTTTPDDATRARLEACLQERAAVEQAVRATADTVEDARRAAERARAALEALPDVADDAPLASAIRAARAAGGVDEQVARARAEEVAARREAEALCARMVPTVRDADTLGRLPVPDRDRVTALLEALVEAREVDAQLATEATAIADEIDRLHRERERIATDPAPLSPAALTDARAARDALWFGLRTALVAGTPADPSAYEDAVAGADAIADTRFLHTSDLARLADLERRLTTFAHDATELSHRRERHATVLADATRAWEEAWSATAEALAAGATGEPQAAASREATPTDDASTAPGQPHPSTAREATPTDDATAPGQPHPPTAREATPTDDATAPAQPHPPTAGAATTGADAPRAAVPSPAQAGAWLAARDAVLAQSAAAMSAACVAESAVALRDQHATALRALLGDDAPAGDVPLSALVELADARLDDLRERAERVARATEAVARTAAELEDAEAAAGRAVARRDEWQRQWTSLRDACGLAASLAPDDALAAVRALDQAVRDRERLEALRDEIAAIDARRAAFEEALGELVETPSVAAASELHRRAAAARAAAAERDALTAAIAEAEAEHAEATAIAAEADDELAALRAAAGATDDEDLVRRERAVARAEELRAELAQLDADLARAGGAPADEVAAAVAELDPDALPARLDALEATAARHRDERDAAAQRLTRARDELARLERSDEAARARQEATVLEAQIQEVAERYARARLAQRVLRDAIARFRSAHEGPLLTRANELFPALTCERFARLETDLDERDRDILVAIRADGSRLRVDQLSDGTREQLFLALRLAAIERHAATAQPVPALFDDVLLESDDQRAERILAALAGLATHTQVIVLTHHRHLVDIAETTVGDRLDVIALAEEDDAPARRPVAAAAPAPRRRKATPRPAEPTADESAPTLAEELEAAVVAGPRTTPSPYGEQTTLM